MENLTETFIEAGMLMLVGMAFVFAFLGMLIFAIKLLAKIASNFEEPVPASTNTARANPNEIPEGVVAAITSAVAHYRKNNGKN
ncbi:OadG family protein [Thalassotalea crassostreae]|uniref:OadG family protein n=1 Tax=Thalassotalea crassostreae TaxID=1763536 RepID=UPI00083800CB|nr:OadG family transporter subunit [Thalassotalea crassostreae]